MKKCKVLFLAITALAMFAACTYDCAENPCAENVCVQTAKPPKYIILIIGDGFGENQRTIARAALGGELVMDSMPAVPTGTNNVYGSTTDSAASGTAIACGIKTYNGAIGVTKDGTPVESLAKKLHAAGYKIGMISNSAITDATPSAHYANRASRGMQAEIGTDMAASGFEFFGGQNPGSSSTYAALQEAGYQVITDPALFDSVAPGTKVYMNKCPTWEWTGDHSENTTLAAYLKQAIRVLDNPDGFFIMVENGFIDYSGHGNDAGWMVREVAALDSVVAAALEFYNQHPEETLVILTADHETGGLQLLDNFDASSCVLLNDQAAGISTLGNMLKEYVRNNPGSVEDGSAVTVAESYFGITLDETTGNAVQKLIEKEDYNNAINTVKIIRDKSIGFNYTTGGHSSAKILTSAIGAGSERFVAPLENSDLPHLTGAAVFGEEAYAGYFESRSAAIEAVQRQTIFAGTTSTLSVVPEYYVNEAVNTCGKNFDLRWPDWEQKLTVNSGSADGVERLEITNTANVDLFFTIAGLDENAEYTVVCGNTLLMPEEGREVFSGAELAAKIFAVPSGAGSYCDFLICSEKGKLTAKNRIVAPDYSDAARPVLARFPAAETAAAPVIDGDASDPQWQNAEAQQLKPEGNYTAFEGGTVKVLADTAHKTLYVLAELDDSVKTAVGSNRDDDVWQGDSFEIMFTSADAGGIWQICINPDGTIFDGAPRIGNAWNGTYNLVSVHENGKWILEIELPLEQLGLSAPLQVNFCRQNKPENTLSSVTVTGGSFHNTNAMIPVDYN